MALTELEIRHAKPKEKPYSKPDGNSLSLLIEPNGSKGWRFRYRFSGKPRMMSLGTYPIVSLTEARQKRDEAKKLVFAGINPCEIRKEQKRAKNNALANTFESIAREWYSKRQDRWSEGYRKDMMSAFEKDIFPYIGHRPIKEIKPLELLAVLSKLEERGATEKLRKVRQRCGEVWKYAIITGRAEYNPAPDLASAMKPHQRKHYAHLSVSQLPAFLYSLDGYMGNQMLKAALHLLIISGVRPGELRNATWDEINLEHAIWEIPAERMKMKRPHIVPLSTQAVLILKQIYPISGHYPNVFPGRDLRDKPINETTLNRLIKRIGYGGKATGHGFRHTMSTILHEQGYNTAWIETQLAHVDKNSIRGTYNHAQYLDGRREMLQWYADYMDKLEKEGVVC
ncbi:tyrosine-type recombinase/integrase [Budvicia aquatica]|uniref:Integrase n=2 Tax=Budvicia aquatica TaxID=82979 RepID=A0A2C6DQH7_9GAMM|nr:tyrosine-type recombinase/integrase [Budvicia aquatica]PHI30953.1 integrase [Budvicia aquatica]